MNGRMKRFLVHCMHGNRNLSRPTVKSHPIEVFIEVILKTVRLIENSTFICHYLLTDCTLCLIENF